MRISIIGIFIFNKIDCGLNPKYCHGKGRQLFIEKSSEQRFEVILNEMEWNCTALGHTS